METKRASRWTYLMQTIIVFGGQLWILSSYDWNILVVYTAAVFPWYLVLIIWLHLLFGVSQLFAYINYHRVDRVPEDTKQETKDDDDENNDGYV